jgi:hypothetical protein
LEDLLILFAQLAHSTILFSFQYDSGGTRAAPASTLFHTFSKARLLCPSTTDGEVFQFNNLELTSVITGDDGEVYIYGLFRAAK